MAIVEFALAYDFVEPVDTSVAYRLEFLYDGDGPAGADLPGFDPVGQVRAVVRGFHPRRGSIVAVSRSGVRYSAVLNAIGRLWPWRGGYQIDLAQIRERLREAGLDAPVRVVSEREKATVLLGAGPPAGLPDGASAAPEPAESPAGARSSG